MCFKLQSITLNLLTNLSLHHLHLTICYLSAYTMVRTRVLSYSCVLYSWKRRAFTLKHLKHSNRWGGFQVQQKKPLREKRSMQCITQPPVKNLEIMVSPLPESVWLLKGKRTCTKWKKVTRITDEVLFSPKKISKFSTIMTGCVTSSRMLYGDVIKDVIFLVKVVFTWRSFND